jgi:hypothetical protein
VSILQSIELSSLEKIDVVRRLGDRRLGNSNLKRAIGLKKNSGLIVILNGKETATTTQHKGRCIGD